MDAVLLCLFLTNILSISLGQGVAFDCDRCTSDPSSCQRISGVYSVTAMTRGTYNPVLEIPSPACSINITEMGTSRNYIAIKTSSNVGIINSYWALGRPGQYYGAGARFAYDRHSESCPGSCIVADGPILSNVMVQILYNGPNPGIRYDFFLPNFVQFKAPTFTDTRTEGEAQTPSPRQPERRTRRHRGRARHIPRSRSPAIPNVSGEYNSGPMSIRSEGRPDETAEARGAVTSTRRVISNQRTPDRPARRLVANQRSSDNKQRRPVSYGSHTLGGRGLSYTASNSRTSRRRGQGEVSRPATSRPQRRYSQQSRRLVRKISPPTYRASTSTAKRNQAQYKAPTSYRSRTSSRTNKYLRTYNGRSSASRATPRSNAVTRYRWKISGLTECSRSCGGGVQKTNIVCVSIGTRTQVVVTPENCGNLHKPRVQTVECNPNPCRAAWESDEWSECSVTCGYGTQTRTIECRRRFSPTLILRVSADQCGVENKPAVAQQCEERRCASWHVGVWSQCNKECGGGERHREVSCVDSYNSPLPSNHCVEASPKHREACNTQLCRAQWWMTDWPTMCSESCGTGYQYRRALCLNDNGKITTETSCDTKHLPEMRRHCESDSSCDGTWIVSSWGKCSARCGRGRRKRTVVCMLITSTTMQQTEDGDCNVNMRPSSEESCVESDCPSVWYSSPWSQCSVTCGQGVKSRDVKCLNANNRPSLACPPSLKPETREPCDLDPCNLYQRTDGQGEETRTAEGLEFEQYLGSDENTSEKSEEDKEKEESSETFGERERSSLIQSNRHGESDDGDEVEETGGFNRPSPSSTYFGEENTEDACEDTFYNCLVVIQSRLCSYEYYRKRCCNSCRKSYGR